MESSAQPVNYEFANHAVHKESKALGVHVSMGKIGIGEAVNVFMPAAQAVRLMIGLKDAIQGVLNRADEETLADVREWLGRGAALRGGVDPISPLFICKLLKEFRVALISAPRNAAGLTQLMLVARDGLSFQVKVDDLHLKAKGDTVRAEVVGDSIVPNEAFMFVEVVRMKSTSNPGVVREVWGK
jgi:hypothetical protein